MQQLPLVERATDSAAVQNTMLTSFTTDPVTRWLFPNPGDYVRNFPALVSALAGPAFEVGETFQVEDLAAAAVWLPPGAEPDAGEIMACIEHSCAADRVDEMMHIAMQMGEHHPTFPHWYLVWLGVDAARQGEGLGSRLIQHTLRKVDAEGLPAYLESPNPKNIAFYQRHGFEVVGRTETPTAPPIHFMLRPPRY